MPRRYLRSPSDAAGPSLERWVYFFGNGRADGSAAMRDILGGKGAGLAEMANLGLPVPPGFTISAKLCLTYLEQGTFPDQLHRSEEHTSELQSQSNLVCRLLLEKKKKKTGAEEARPTTHELHSSCAAVCTLT